MWIGTSGGLNRFDGQTIKVFRHDNSNTSTICSNGIQCLAKDHLGRLWIGTENGLCRYDNTSNTFIKYSWPYIVPIPSAGNLYNIFSLAEDEQHNLWLGTKGGLIQYDFSSGKFTLFGIIEPTLLGNFRSNRINCLAADHRGHVWIGTQNGCHCFTISTKKFTFFKPVAGDSNSISSHRISAINVDGSGNIWIGIFGYGIDMYDPIKKHFRHFKLFNDLTAEIRDILFDITGDCWLGTDGKGLFLLNVSTGKFFQYRYLLGHHDGLSDDRITTLFRDSSGMVWIGTEKSGTDRFNISHQKFISYFGDYNASPVIEKYDVRGLLVGHRGEYFAATDKGLIWYDPLTSIFRSYRNNKNKNSISNDLVYVVFMDKEDQIWVGTYNGLNIFHHNTRSFTHFQHLPLLSNTFENPSMNEQNKFFVAGAATFSIIQSFSGKILLGTSNGLNVYDPATHTFRNLFNDTTIAKLPPAFYTHLFEDSRRQIWIATSHDVCLLDSSFHLVKKYLANPAIKNSIPDNNVNAFLESTDNKIWLATDNGLCKLDPVSDIITNYSVKDGLADNSIQALAFDSTGNLWISTGKGLTKMNLKGKFFTNFTSADGLQGNEFNPGSVFIMGNKLMFGGSNGFTVVDPEKVILNKIVPKVQLTSFKVMDEEFFPHNDLNALHEVKLGYNQNFFSFEMASLNFDHPGNNQFRYMLEGFDKSWKLNGNLKFAGYTNVPPGSYTLHVQGSNNDGVWNNDGVIFHIIIGQPFWKTWWFITLCIFVIMLLLYLFIRWREKKIKTIEIANQQLAELQLSALRSQMNPHFIFNALNSIKKFVIANETAQAEKYLGKFSKLIRSILDNTASGVVTIEKELQLLNLYLELEQLRFNKRLEYHIVLDEQINPHDISIPSMIVQPFVENSILHGIMHSDHGGAVIIRFDLKSTWLQVTVEDNGVGRENAMRYNQDHRTEPHQSRGIEVTNRRLIALRKNSETPAGITIVDLLNDKGEAAGTRVIVSIPL